MNGGLVATEEARNKGKHRRSCGDDEWSGCFVQQYLGLLFRKSCRLLESLQLQSPVFADRLFSGFCLFCIFGRLRFRGASLSGWARLLFLKALMSFYPGLSSTNIHRHRWWRYDDVMGIVILYLFGLLFVDVILHRHVDFVDLEVNSPNFYCFWLSASSF